MLKEELTQVNLNICLFYTLKTMSGRKTCQFALEIPSKIVYFRSDESYQKLKKHLGESIPKSVYDYCIKNCNEIRDKWLAGQKFGACSFLKRTRNHVESINAKLKSVVTR